MPTTNAVADPTQAMPHAVPHARETPGTREPAYWLLREWRRLGLWLPVALGVGIAWYFLLPGPTRAGPWLTGAACGYLAAVIGLVGMRQLHHRAGFLACWILGMAMGTVGLGAGVAARRLPELETPILRQELDQTTLSGVIEDILVQPDSLKVTLSQLRIDALAGTPPARVRVTSRRYRTEAPSAEDIAAGRKILQAGFDIGDRVILRATLFPPPTPASPGQFDYARHFFFQGIGGVGFSNAKITVLKPAAEAQGWAGRLSRFRLHLSERIRQQIGVVPGRRAEGAVAISLMTGQQNAIPKNVNDAMRVSGISHILSISGLHLALASGIVFVALRLLLLALLPGRLRDRGAKKIAAFVALLAAFAYLAAAGFPIAAERAYVMIAVVLLGTMLDRQALGLRSLAIAAGLLLLWQPEALLSSSFKLSFAATLAIVAWAEVAAPLALRFQAREGIPAWLRTAALYVGGALMTSFVASTITAPIIMADFQQFNSYGLVTNLLVSPLVSFWIMPLVVISFLALPVGLEALPLEGLGWGIHQMIVIAERMAALPYASIPTPTLPPLGMALATFGGLWLLLWRSGWLRALGLLGIAAGLMLATATAQPHVLVSRDARQVAARLPDGRWRMMTGSARNLTAQQWLEATGQKSYAQPPRPEKDGTAVADAHCTSARCLWDTGEAQVMLRFDAKPLRVYHPRAPKKPDDELSETERRRRIAAREKSAALRAEKQGRQQAARQVDAEDAATDAVRLSAPDLLLDGRSSAAQASAPVAQGATYIPREAMLAARGMALWREGGVWRRRTVAEQQGDWPWAGR